MRVMMLRAMLNKSGSAKGESAFAIAGEPILVNTTTKSSDRRCKSCSIMNGGARYMIYTSKRNHTVLLICPWNGTEH